MATLETRIAKLEGLMVVADERDPDLIKLLEWLCGVEGKQFKLEHVPCGVTASEFLKACSGRSLPIYEGD